MCYAHVMRNVKLKYKFDNSRANKDDFMDDIRCMHQSADEAIFDIGADLFVQKWIANEAEATRRFEK